VADHPRITDLRAKLRVTWGELLARPIAREFLTSDASADRRMFAIYLIQAYHYAWHTARNQALVAVNPRMTDVKYMQFCLDHALEEVGHELMALHDLRALGLVVEDPARDLPPPLPATDVLVAYLYFVSSHGNPVQRLGYSFWAEAAYPQATPFVEGIKHRMGLTNQQMTFFFKHKEIDAKHEDDATKAMLLACKTDEDWRAVERTAQTSLRLQFQMIEDAVREYQRLAAGEPSDYAALTAAIKRG
jgi:pyrroloquinoline quinone (PQQ) biosynthesis protein C